VTKKPTDYRRKAEVYLSREGFFQFHQRLKDIPVGNVLGFCHARDFGADSRAMLVSPFRITMPHDRATHIAAMKPHFLTTDTLTKESTVYRRDDAPRRGASWQFDSHFARSLKARAKPVAARSKRTKVLWQPGVTQTTQYREGVCFSSYL
jgi:hypothetical protein